MVKLNLGSNFSRRKIRYFLQGLKQRMTQSRTCPNCAASVSELVDTKYIYQLRRCAECLLQYRWPCESADELEMFYEEEYEQAGLTTDLPNVGDLEKLLSTEFVGSEKDFTISVELVKFLNVPGTARILDFGANWGYSVRQFRNAGYDCIGYESAVSRAEYAQNIGVQVLSDISVLKRQEKFDVVYSSHVIEHVTRPAELLDLQINLVKEDGYIVGTVPNGSEAFRLSHYSLFHRLWGQVHPLMLDTRFFLKKFGADDLYLGALNSSELPEIGSWDRLGQGKGNCELGELLFIWKKKKQVSRVL